MCDVKETRKNTEINQHNKGDNKWSN